MTFIDRRRPCLWLFLGAILFAMFLFLFFVGIVALDRGKSVIQGQFDFADFLRIFDARSCYKPLISTTRHKIKVLPYHVKLVNEIQNFLINEKEDVLAKLLSDCDEDIPLPVCFLEKTCPRFWKDNNESEEGRFDVWQSEAEAAAFVSATNTDDGLHRFDLVSASERKKRLSFLERKAFKSELEFCDAIFKYVLITTSPFESSRLTKEYRVTGEVSEEIVHLLIMFMTMPAHRAVVDRLNCSKIDYHCLLSNMCENEIYPGKSDIERADAAELQGFMQSYLSPCMGERCRAHSWLVSDSRGWFSSCWLASGGFLQILPTDPVDVSVIKFNRPCNPARRERERAFLFAVAFIYVFLYAFAFFVIEISLYYVISRCRHRISRPALRDASRRLASSLPSLMNARRATTPRGSQISHASSWRGRLDAVRRGRRSTEPSFMGSLAGISSQSTDSGLGSNFRLSTPRSSVPHLNVFVDRPVRRGPHSNDYVLASSMSVLPTPISRQARSSVRRSSSQRAEPILNFLFEETFIGAGGEILERLEREDLMEGEVGVAASLEEDSGVIEDSNHSISSAETV